MAEEKKNSGHDVHSEKNLESSPELKTWLLKYK